MVIRSPKQAKYFIGNLKILLTQFKMNNLSSIEKVANRLIVLENQFKQDIKALTTKYERELKELKDTLRNLQSTPELLLDQTVNFDGKRSMTIFPSDEEEIKRPRYDFQTKNGFVQVYTDGACANNGRSSAKAGIGVWFDHFHPLNISAKCPTRPTNNSAEIQAVVEACKVAKKNGVDKLEILTDSQFLINCMTKWLHNWQKKNWRTAAGKPVINKEDLLMLIKESEGITLKYTHVAGHSGIEGNEEADKLAVAGAEK